MARKRRTSSESSKQFGDFLKRNRVGITAFAIIALLATALIFRINSFFSSASCFEVKKIEIVKPGRGGGLYVQKEYFDLEYPVNVFAVDAVVLSKKIKEAYPDKIVIVTKFLPNRIVASIKDREAVARIKVGSILPVDFDGIILSETRDLDSLPLITGLESQLTNPKAGARVRSKRLNTALVDILKRIYLKKEFNKSVVATIDMTYPEKAFFTLDGMTVIIGNGDFERKIDGLALALSDPNVDKKKIDSIDLRFTDPIITFMPESK